MTSYFLGIDLGTSNSAAAFAEGDEGEVRTLPLLQSSGESTTSTSSLLPSALYLAPQEEISHHLYDLPWTAASPSPYVVGLFAREKGALVPERLIASTKSWLSNPKVDRSAAILPWQSPLAALSPIDVSRHILEHIRHAVSHELGFNVFDLDAHVVVTVPASFDEVARTLTAKAAEDSGIKSLTLLEEPQAAFYDWLAQTGRRWNKEVRPGDIILVCDVGGGTADFTLLAASDHDGNLELTRLSVGDHILLGGDNMDLALAFAVRETLGATLDDWQLRSLVELTRQAKEKLLSGSKMKEVPLTIPSRGSNLFASPVSGSVSRDLVQSIVLDGFFPNVPVSACPDEKRTSGLREFGLPYAADPAITKHLAAFLSKSFQRISKDPALAALIPPGTEGFFRPTHILFNGGVFNSAILRKRTLEVLTQWTGGGEVKELKGAHLDLSVARGACHYARLKASGKGVRIRSGTTRSYYIGVETSAPAVPGYKQPLKGLCVMPHGIEEGTTLAVPGANFGLVVGEDAVFRFFSSADRPLDPAGAAVPDAQKELAETLSLHLTLPADSVEENIVPVSLEATVTEVGTLELWMRHVHSEARWKLEFNVREE